MIELPNGRRPARLQTIPNDVVLLEILQGVLEWPFRVGTAAPLAPPWPLPRGVEDLEKLFLADRDRFLRFAIDHAKQDTPHLAGFQSIGCGGVGDAIANVGRLEAHQPALGFIGAHGQRPQRGQALKSHPHLNGQDPACFFQVVAQSLL